MTNTINEQTRTDLHRVWLLLADPDGEATNSTTNPTEVADLLPGVNVRYARELLGLLVRLGVFEVIYSETEGQLWRAARLTWTDEDLDSAASDVLNLNSTGEATSTTQGAKKMVKTESKPKATKPAAPEFNLCACGCGRQISRKSTFAQGHDARMVSQLAVVVVEGSTTTGKEAIAPKLAQVKGYLNEDIQHRINQATKDVEGAFSKALADKFYNAAMGRWAKVVGKTEAADAKAAKQAAKATKGVEHGKVKVGRWEYDAVRDHEGVRYTKKDGSEHVADAKVAETFTKA